MEDTNMTTDEMTMPEQIGEVNTAGYMDSTPTPMNNIDYAIHLLSGLERMDVINAVDQILANNHLTLVPRIVIDVQNTNIPSTQNDN